MPLKVVPEYVPFADDIYPNYDVSGLYIKPVATSNSKSEFKQRAATQDDMTSFASAFNDYFAKVRGFGGLHYVPSFNEHNSMVAANHDEEAALRHQHRLDPVFLMSHDPLISLPFFNELNSMVAADLEEEAALRPRRQPHSTSALDMQLPATIDYGRRQFDLSHLNKMLSADLGLGAVHQTFEIPR
eukprot:gene38-12847_t